jgi:hypothetical protein
MQPTIPGDTTQLFGFASRGRCRLLDYNVFSVLQSEPHQRTMTVWWRNDQHNIRVRLYDFNWVRNQPQARPARLQV